MHILMTGRQTIKRNSCKIIVESSWTDFKQTLYLDMPDMNKIAEIADEITEDLDADSSAEEITEMVFNMGHDIHTAIHVATYLGR